MPEVPLPGRSIVPQRRGVVAVLIRQAKMLVIRRALGVVAPGALCFPGGGIERDETEPVALQRELREELAAEIVPLTCLWRSVTPWGVEIAWWHAELSPSANVVPNPAEVAEVLWLTCEEMLASEDLLQSNRSFLEAFKANEFSLEQVRPATLSQVRQPPADDTVG